MNILYRCCKSQDRKKTSQLSSIQGFNSIISQYSSCTKRQNFWYEFVQDRLVKLLLYVINSWNFHGWMNICLSKPSRKSSKSSIWQQFLMKLFGLAMPPSHQCSCQKFWNWKNLAWTSESFNFKVVFESRVLKPSQAFQECCQNQMSIIILISSKFHLIEPMSNWPIISG